jgi:hypothetical protein
MKKIFLFLPLLWILAFSACQQDKEASLTDLTLNFTADFAEDPLVMYGRTYAYPNNTDFRLQLFQFYISDVYLIKSDGTAGPKVLDVALVSFGGVQSESEAAQGVSVVLKDVPVGQYSGIRLGLGVDPVLNKTQPGDYRVDHPLSTNYWLMSNSYVFSKIEGNADTDGSGNFNAEVTLHVGGDNNYREKTFPQPIELRAGQPNSLGFSVDLRRMLVDDTGKFLNFAMMTQIHSDQSPWAVFISDNFMEAISMRK